MRLTIFLIMTAVLQATASVYSQTTKIKLHLKEASLESAFQLLHEQTGYDFFFVAEQLPAGKRVTVNFDDTPISKALDDILAGTGLVYRVLNKDIIITKGSASDDDSAFKATQQQRDVSGTVSDGNGVPLPGVTVVLKGTTMGTITNVDGHYTLQKVPSDAVLAFSFVGMKSKEIAVEGRSVIHVIMQEDAIGIEEVVAVGYGVQKKVNLTGAVSQVTSEVLKDRPITNVGQGLQGVIPNLVVTLPDGNPNSTPEFNIRGTATINGNESPLVLVDGIQMNMNLLNPNDIESISVLKDAASAAIYGARGAFGVILVTTKKGAKNRKPQISYTGNLQLNTHTYLPDVFSAPDYMEAANEAQFNANQSYKYNEEQVRWVKEYNEDPLNNPVYHVLPNGKVFWNGGQNNSYKEMIQKWAPVHKHTLSLNGGTDRINYYASTGYLNQEGLFETATDVFKRYNFTLNLEVNATDWLKLGFKSSYDQTTYDEPHRYEGKGTSWWEQMTRGEPQILFPIVTPEDSPVGEGVPTAHFFNFLNSGSRNVTHNENAIYSINAEANILKGLSLKGDFSYRSHNRRNKDVQKTFGFITDSWQLQYNQTTPSYVERSTMHEDFFFTNIYGDYQVKLKDNHNIHVLLGFNQEWNVDESFSSKRESLISGDIPVIKLGTGTEYTNDAESAWAIRGIFARLKYNFKEKYLFEMNGRYDGTSKFPKESRFDFFPSISLGWRISEEPFMEWSDFVIDNLKFRGSYGSLGNQNVSGNYPYISNFGINQQVSYIINGELPIGVIAPGLIDANLTWETSTTLNFGLDASILKKLNLSFDWYKRMTTDMLTAGDKLPAVLGASVPDRNNAELKTTGWELTLNWRNNLRNGLKYDLGIVLSDYNSTITKFDNNPNKIYTSYYEGQKVGEIWGYETVGIFQSPEEVESSPSQNRLGNNGKWKPGDVRYANLNDDNVIDWGDRTVDNPGDTKIIGNKTPRYQFGITGNIAYKGFDLNVLFQGIGKRDFMPSGNYYWGHLSNSAAVGTYEIWNNAWREDNTDSYYPMYKSSSSYNILPQTRFLQSGAYIRLKNITLGYTLPRSITSKVELSNCRIYFSGYNLWEYATLRGNFDPEIIGKVGEYYPMQRSLLFGLEITL